MSNEQPHIPEGFSLSEFEELDPLCERVPDWQKYKSNQQFSGYLRELTFNVDDAEVCEALDDAAERLDQAHIEVLRAEKLPRDKATEEVYSWAYQHGRSMNGTLDAYCEARGLRWVADAMYNYVKFSEV